MEEEDLGVGDGCGEQTRGATASAGGHGLGRAVPSVECLQPEAETEKLNELMQSSFFLPYFICLIHLIYSILLQGY
jgi:serine phosphatase RsbU (regulator of sigma subunit)